ncbi:PLP-dependent aminotransferase family protein [Lichenibacterium minor]|nr:PLP-dependent aminotransferase family protein [Lichenibacterium minor]
MDQAAATRTGAVMEAIRRRIAARALGAGDRLPSIRGFAATMGVSPSTVVEAYDRLAAEGLIRSRPGSGFTVAGHPPLAVAAIAARPDPAMDPLWVSRRSLDAGAAIPKPGCGWLPPDWMPVAALRRSMRRIARGGDAVLTDYGDARGSADLRRLLARRFAAEGLDAGPDAILLTASASQSFDLVCRALLRPGDTVLVDDPCYFNFQAALRAHGARAVGVAMTPSGPDPDLFAAALDAHRPRIYVTNSALQNPTGATLSAQAAHRLLGAAAAHDLAVVEDDTFADLEPEPSPRLAVLDGLGRVIRIGGFSKTLSASTRCGYVAAKPDLVEALVDLQVATSFGGPSPVAAGLVHGALSDGSYRKHLASLRTRLSEARRDTAGRLCDLGIRPWLMPRGGFTLWCRLPDGRDAAAAARAASRDDVVLAPGDVFSVSQTATDMMRFNVAQMSDPRVYPVLARALAAA